MCKLCTCLRKKPPPRSPCLESSGVQPAEFLIKEMLCTDARDFIKSFLSCCLKTEKAVSEHAVIPPCTESMHMLEAEAADVSAQPCKGSLGSSGSLSQRKGEGSS